MATAPTQIVPAPTRPRIVTAAQPAGSFCGGGQTVSSKQRVSAIKPRLNSLDEKEIGHRKKRNCGQQ
jgi:hypothetical protein